MKSHLQNTFELWKWKRILLNMGLYFLVRPSNCSNNRRQQRLCPHMEQNIRTEISSEIKLVTQEKWLLKNWWLKQVQRYAENTKNLQNKQQKVPQKYVFRYFWTKKTKLRFFFAVASYSENTSNRSTTSKVFIQQSFSVQTFGTEPLWYIFDQCLIWENYSFFEKNFPFDMEVKMCFWFIQNSKSDSTTDSQASRSSLWAFYVHYINVVLDSYPYVSLPSLCRCHIVFRTNFFDHFRPTPRRETKDFQNVRSSIWA